MKIRLRVRESPRASFDWEHVGPSVCIGRADDCQLVFRGNISETVSSKHLQIELSPAGAAVKDLGSTNGTYLNGASLTALAPLGVGDHLQLGLAGPRIEVLAIDLQDSRASTRWRWAAPRRPSLIAAGIGVAAVICLIVLVVAMRRPTDPSHTKDAAAGPATADIVEASLRRPVSKDAAAAEVDGNPQTNVRPSKTAAADTDENGAEGAGAAALSHAAPAAARLMEKPPAPSAQSAHQPADKPTREPPATKGIGILTSNHEILVRAVGDEWSRVTPEGPVYAGERLIALPTYRPSVTIGDGLTVRLMGGAIVSFDAAQDVDAAKIGLFSGRVVLLIAAGHARTIELRAGDCHGTLEFDGDKSTFAVEARRLLPDGSDPQRENAASTTVDFHLSSGKATWIDEQGRREKLGAPSHWSPDSRQAGKPSADKPPAWMEADELSSAERAASAELDDVLKPGEPVAAAINNRARHRLLESSALALRCLASIDDFEPLVPALNDARYRAHWARQIESLRTALARSPETATLVRAAFASVRGGELGDQLYRMLWGYTSGQLEDGALVQLIDWLGAADDRMDFRVLSFWNLHRFTGLRLNYQPTAPEQQRRASILRWKQKLESGLLAR